MPPSRQNEATSVFSLHISLSLCFSFSYTPYIHHDNDDNTEYHARACQSKRDAGNQSAAYYFRISEISVHHETLSGDDRIFKYELPKKLP